MDMYWADHLQGSFNLISISSPVKGDQEINRFYSLYTLYLLSRLTSFRVLGALKCVINFT